jgi:hypothetical protein
VRVELPIMTNRTWNLVLAIAALAVWSACTANPTKPSPEPPAPVMTHAEADTFAKSLTNALNTAMADCYSRVNFHPNAFGTTQLNFSCGATRGCAAGGTIRPSLTATGQLFVSPTTVSLSMPLSGSQNILDWECAGNYLISGNPTVSLTGQLSVSTTTAYVGRIDHSGQIIYGRRGGSQRTCSISLRSTDGQTSVHTTGSICGYAIDITV